jgi:hypothetical protein
VAHTCAFICALYEFMPMISCVATEWFLDTWHSIICVYVSVLLLGTFENLQKLTNSFVMHGFLSVHTGQLGFHCTDLHEI